MADIFQLWKNAQRAKQAARRARGKAEDAERKVDKLIKEYDGLYAAYAKVANDLPNDTTEIAQNFWRTCAK